MSKRSAIASGLLGLVIVFAMGQAPDQPGPRRGGARPGPDRPRGGFDMGQMRERMMNNLKEQLGATDEQWKTVSPQIDQIMTLHRETRGGFGAAFMGRPRPTTGTSEATSELAKAQADLQAAVQEKQASPEEITKKLTALRDARAKALKELDAAQKELKSEVTPRQEAVLVLNGILN